tara:strand:+ start:1203 stop:1397 length:195 start_codon:yes stop_codon:yes gene_type:complete
MNYSFHVENLGAVSLNKLNSVLGLGLNTSKITTIELLILKKELAKQYKTELDAVTVKLNGSAIL